MHFLYILYSNSSKKYYVGESHNVEERLNKHNAHDYKNSFTKIAVDWEVVLKFPTGSKQEALYLEMFIKRMKSRKFIEKVISDPLILKNILEKR